jgi:hypothetical protein
MTTITRPDMTGHPFEDRIVRLLDHLEAHPWLSTAEERDGDTAVSASRLGEGEGVRLIAAAHAGTDPGPSAGKRRGTEGAVWRRHPSGVCTHFPARTP